MTAYSLQTVRERPEAIRQIVLIEQGLKLVPTEIRACRSLLSLDLRNNVLSELPDWLAELSALETLRLDGNTLTKLPVFLAALPNLRYASFAGNQISRLSKNQVLPTNLQTLDLNRNRISTWPAGILDQVTLEKLDLSYNPLGTFPDCATATGSLQYVHLIQTRLKSLPKNLAKFQQLRQLFLSRNQLTDRDLPDKWPPKLEQLDLSYNQLLRLPAKLSQAVFLRKLHLDHNQLKDVQLPKDLRWLSDLTLSHNHLTRVRKGKQRETALALLDVSENPDLTTLEVPESGLRTLIIDGCDLREVPVLPDSLRTLSARRNRKLSAETIRGGPQLEHIDLSYTNLETPDWPLLPNLRSLNIRQTPLSRRHPLPEQLIKQANLTKLSGYRRTAERRHLLTALDLGRRYGLSPETALIAWRALRDPEKAVKTLTTAQMLPWLTWDHPELWPLVLQKLRDRYGRQPDRAVLDEIGIQFKGTFPGRDQRITRSDLGKIPQTEGGCWILGSPPFSPPLELPVMGVLDEAAFWQWQEQTSAATKLDQHQLNQIRRLLWSDQVTNQQLAIHLIRGLRVPNQLWPALVIQWKRTESEKVRRELRAILQASLPGRAKIILNRNLSFQRSLNLPAFRQKIKQLTEGAGIPMKDTLDRWEWVKDSRSGDQGPG
jgi:Leucine-rich repeat (LRR) protein